MSFSKISALSGVLALASGVAAHGRVDGIVADGIYYAGYNMNSQYMATPIESVGWSIPEDQGNGPITGEEYANADIICHLNATNAQLSAPVSAGGSVELQWSAWPSSHHGPVIDYLADCGGDCSTVDKTTLKWFKIDGVGLIDDTTVPGTWADDQLIANNNSWTVTIPSDIASGNYVLRHEIIALHSAGEANGAQNYPQCVNLQITGTGTATPEGTLGTALYTPTDPGLLINIYAAISSYVVPGPALYSGAISATQSADAAATGVASGVAGTGVAETTAVATSAAVVASSAAPLVVASSAQVTSAPAVTAAPYSNSTVATSSKKSKTACKAKTSKALAAVSESKTKSVAAVMTSSIAADIPSVTKSAITTEAASVTIATTSSAIESEATASSSATASTGNTKAATVSEPTGTTLGDLLSWLSSFYTKHADSTYDAATVARRHARDIAQRDMDKFDGEHHHATGTGARGVAKATGVHHHGGHARPSGTGRNNLHSKPSGTAGGKVGGHAKPTGIVERAPKGTGNAHAHKHGHGGAKPTGAFGAGSAMPTAARSYKHAGF